MKIEFFEIQILYPFLKLNDLKGDLKDGGYFFKESHFLFLFQKRGTLQATLQLAFL
ncbi:hypothetical protein SacN8_03075 [Sulfolobus acidocaldarius N8]|uniref:Uncharacterized protein n=2 Tax=Sulfolobus acidocaldarius TaxID=2285 RepID=M1J0N0_9CREN|nr:hypothetical protein SacN8_03075 [Sulfolobus acidocaldarius N8]AGE72866.1 hypothetical protein SacRon12I_03065 [Sulfolobus acidocaldarius Ron12/I]